VSATKSFAWQIYRIIAGVNPVADDPVIAPDRELEEEKPPTHPLPAVRLVTAQGRQMVLHVRLRVEYFRHGRRLPSLPSPVEFDAMPVL
jgi:hypothetical protein